MSTLIEQMKMFTLQAGSKRVLNAKSDKFQGNIHKRGKVQDVSPVSCPCNVALLMVAFVWSQAKLRLKLIRLLLQKSSSKVAVGPIMLGFFLFVVVGSGTTALYRMLLACLV